MSMIEIQFEKTDGVYTLKDAIVLTADQYAKMTPSDIEAEKQSRWDNFIYDINNPAPNAEETIEEQIGV